MVNVPRGTGETNLKICRDLAWTNLDTCFIFAGLAKRELETGVQGQAERALRCAQCGYDSILRFLNKIESEVHRREVQVKLNELRERLEFLSQML